MSPRWHWRPTRRLVGLLFAALIIYGAAANSLIVWLYIVVAFFLGLIPLGLVGPFLTIGAGSTHGNGYRREGFLPPLPDRERLYRGDRLTLFFQTHLDPLRVTFTVQADDGTRHTATAWQEKPGLVALQFVVQQRGWLRFQTLHVFTSWPVGLLTVEKEIPFSTTYLVYPRYVVAGRSEGPLRHAIGGEIDQQRGHGDDVIGLRPYQWGDNRRHIHWMTSARMGELMVTEHAAPALDALRCTLCLTTTSTAQAQERTVEVATSLLAGYRHEDRPFRMQVGTSPEGRTWDDAFLQLATAQPHLMTDDDEAGITCIAHGDTVVVRRGGEERVFPADTPLTAIVAEIQ